MSKSAKWGGCANNPKNLHIDRQLTLTAVLLLIHTLEFWGGG